MLAAGIAELRTGLRKYLAHVKNGENVVITDRGKPVARIVPEESQPNSAAGRLRLLADAGTVILPSRERSRKARVPSAIEGRPLSEIVSEDR
jgi:prevent-host-death family protein